MFLKGFQTLLMLFLYWKYFRCTVLAVTYPEETKLVFHYGPQFDDSMEYNLWDATSILTNPNFVDGEIHMYMHGYHDTQDAESNHVIVEAYNKRKTVNLITVDWDKASNEDYLTDSLINVELLAPALAQSILDLYKAGVKRENVRLVGHSLGAQLAGMTARQVTKKTNGDVKIYRLDALDAALFVPPVYETVNRDDVEFLQAIHTDIVLSSQSHSIGTVDFWPNGGYRLQPGCYGLDFLDPCSHNRAWRFWAESVAPINGKKFLGFPSSSYKKFQEDGADNLKKQSIEMGIDCPMDAKGSYYLQTNGQTPFAKGKDGY